METLDDVASTNHLKMKLYNDSGYPVLVKDDLCGARLIHEATLKNSLASAASIKERRKKVDEVTNIVDLDVHENKVLQDEELSIPARGKINTLRSILDGDFDVVHLDDYPMCLVRVGVNLLVIVKKGLIECLKANADLNSIFW